MKGSIDEHELISYLKMHLKQSFTNIVILVKLLSYADYSSKIMSEHAYLLGIVKGKIKDPSRWV